MPVVTKWSSLPVAILAIALLTATPPAQCDKLGALKPDRVHRRQTVLHTSSGSSVDTKAMQCGNISPEVGLSL